jgi:acyl-coenzyme A thioesterase PaaI-like protein
MTVAMNPRDPHIIGELGLRVVPDGELMIGTAQLQPELNLPGTRCLRTSVLAMWADIVCGMLVALQTAPRVPVTLDLAVELISPPVDLDEVQVIGRIVKAGRTAITTEYDVVDGSGLLIGRGGAAFMLAPDVSLALPDNDGTLAALAERSPSLTQPYAQRANCVRTAPGVASMPHTHETGNAAGTLQGGLIALVAEEAALSLAPPDSTLTSMGLRYLRPARVGPAVATADRHGDLSRVEVRDAGSSDRLCVLVTGRTAPVA